MLQSVIQVKIVYYALLSPTHYARFMQLSMLRPTPLCTGIGGDLTQNVSNSPPLNYYPMSNPYPLLCEGIIVIIIITKITSDDHTRAYEQVLELTHAQVKSHTPGA